MNEEQKQQKTREERGQGKEAGTTWASFYMISLLFHFSLFAIPTTALSANVCVQVCVSRCMCVPVCMC